MKAAFQVRLTQVDDDRVVDFDETYIVFAPNATVAMTKGYKAAFKDGPDNRHPVILRSLERLNVKVIE